MQKNLQQAYAHKQILIYNYTLGFKTFLIMTAIIHISACTFMYICTDNGMIGDDFDGYYTLYDYDITDPVEFYGNSLISVTTTFTTIGYGNEPIISPVEKIMLMALMIVGVLLISWLRD